MSFTFNSRMRVLGALGLLLLGGGTSLLAQPQTTPSVTATSGAPVKSVSMGGITEYRMPNGLRVLLMPDPTKPTMTVNVTYLVGSRHENYGETGMAHLLEHMVFKRTEKYSGENGTENPRTVLNRLGARFNGSTNYDRTNYFITFSASEDNLRQVLDLESQRMGHSLLLAQDLWNEAENRGERTVVINELDGGENDPIGVTLFRTLGAAFHWHNYGKSVIGCRADLEKVDIKNLQHFYRTFYQPDNAVLFVAGKIDEARTLALVQQYFGSIPRPERVLPKTYTLDSVPDGEREVTVRRAGDAKALCVAYRICAGADPDSASLRVLSSILTEPPAGRLYKALVESKRAAVVFPYMASTAEPGFLVFGAQLPKDGNMEEAKAILLKEIEQIASRPVSREEVERARQGILAQYELAATQTDQLGGMSDFGISEYIAEGDWRFFYLFGEQIRAVTPETVQKVAQRYLKSSNRSLGQFLPTDAPDRADIPEVKDVAALLKDFRGPEKVSMGEAFDTAPLAIESRTRRFTTKAGLQAVMVPKKTRGETVSLAFTLHFGDEKSLMGKGTTGSLTASMLLRGTAKHSRQEIQDAFDRLKAQVQCFGSAESLTFTVNTVRSSLPEVIRLIGEVLQEPAFPAQEFETLRQENLTGLEAQRSEPEFVATNVLTRHCIPYPKGHPLETLSVDDSLAELKAAKAEDLKSFHKSFYGAGAGELAIVGDMEPAETQKLVEDVLGSWKASMPFVRIPRKVADVSKLDQIIETPDKANAIFLASRVLPVMDSDADYPALFLGNYLLGAQRSGRLRMRIREKEGLSYTALAQLQPNAKDPASVWFSYIQFNPQNLDRLEVAFREEVERSLREGFTEQEINLGKQSWQQGQEVGRSQDQSLAFILMSNLNNGRTMAFQADLEKKIMALTGEQIAGVFRKYFDPARINIVKVGDFKKGNVSR